MPASAIPVSTSTDELAGPIVHTIFVVLFGVMKGLYGKLAYPSKERVKGKDEKSTLDFYADTCYIEEGSLYNLFT